MKYLFHYNICTDKFKLDMRQFHTGADVSCISYFDLICQSFSKARLRKNSKKFIGGQNFLEEIYFAMSGRTYKM